MMFIMQILHLLVLLPYKRQDTCVLILSWPFLINVTNIIISTINNINIIIVIAAVMKNMIHVALKCKMRRWVIDVQSGRVTHTFITIIVTAAIYTLYYLLLL